MSRGLGDVYKRQILINQLQRGEAAARRVFAVVDLEPEIYDKEDAIELVDDITSVEFKDVHFTTPTLLCLY